MNKLYELTIVEASVLLKSKKITAVRLVKSCLNRIKNLDTKINAFITIIEDSALKQATKIDQIKKMISPLAGIPYSLKDVYVTKGIKTTAGSKMLADYIPPYDATVQKKLDAAGAILIGKTNCDPFGFGSSTEHSAFGSTKNPVNIDYVPGGSSGGSGAAVAYGGGLFSIGEDTGGSIRCPASFCGITGLKPTYGRVSRYGSIAYASSYDSVGPMTKTVADNAMVLQIIAGKDKLDATSNPITVPIYENFLNKSLKGKKIGLPKEFFTNELDTQVKHAIENAKKIFIELGCKLVNLSLPHIKFAVASYYVVGLSEASSNLARLDGIRYGHKKSAEGWQNQIKKTRGQAFSDETKRRIMIGTYVLSAGYTDQYYKKAQKVRTLLREDFLKAFQQVDIILTPTMPVLPFKIGEKNEDPLKMWLIDSFTTPTNPVGVPAISIPVGYSDTKLPIGMQLIAPHFREDVLFNFGHQWQINNTK